MFGNGKITRTHGEHRGGEVLRCSFCSKTQDDVKKLIAGPADFICDECVSVCADIMADDTGSEALGQDSPEGRRWQARALMLTGTPDVCGLCGRLAIVGEMLLIGSRGSLCGECADVVEDALAQGKPAS